LKDKKWSIIKGLGLLQKEGHLPYSNRRKEEMGKYRCS
jgi:hypothetical protein